MMTNPQQIEQNLPPLLPNFLILLATQPDSLPSYTPPTYLKLSIQQIRSNMSQQKHAPN